MKVSGGLLYFTPWHIFFTLVFGMLAVRAFFSWCYPAPPRPQTMPYFDEDGNPISIDGSPWISP